MIGRRGYQWAIAMVVGAAPFCSTLDAQSDILSDAGWLAGCWEARAGNRTTTETWMVPGGGLMVGAGRTIVGGVARSFEHLRIRTDGAQLIYTAVPSGQRETSFRSTHLSDTLIVFENPEHDFPQRIAYRKLGSDSLVARVEGPAPSGGSRGFSVPMVRSRCAEQAESSFINRVWVVAESRQVATGSTRIFLADGTLVMTSANATPAFGQWRRKGSELVIVEAGIEYPTEILNLSAQEFRIRMRSPGDPVEMRLVPASQPPQSDGGGQARSDKKGT